MKFLPFFFLALVILSCGNKETWENNLHARLNFSTDSILFDTVFTQRGTTTRSLKIFNYNKGKILINRLSLAGGGSSSFKINVNGLATNDISNLELKANDSIYVFVKAFIDPQQEDVPFLIEDSLIINFNQKTHKIPLVAYGQNAVYLTDENILTDRTLKKGKPYILYGNNIVNEGVTLTIEPGVRMHFHKKAKLSINGTLNANGTLNDSITFTGDRLERIYRNEPGQWSGLQFGSGSINNHLNYCIVKNAISGIHIDAANDQSSSVLLLTNCTIKNHEVTGLLAYNTNIVGINNLFFNCGQHLLAILNGGRYQLYQNTFAGYNFQSARVTPSVRISDHSPLNTKYAHLDIDMRNNIIWGTTLNELSFEMTASSVNNIRFSDNLIKTNLAHTFPYQENNIFNIDPGFLNPRYENFTTTPQSPIHQSGREIESTLFKPFIDYDKNGSDRKFPSSLGCFEKN